MAQDTGKFRENTKDQYYTEEGVAKACVERILEAIPGAAEHFEWIEPSAGSGVFLRSLAAAAPGARCLGLDIDPKDTAVVKADFLTWEPAAGSAARRIFFGNPPFGRQSCTAKAFLAHAARWAEVLAFILPLSFTKPSMSRAIPPLFHCIVSEPLPRNSFRVNGAPHDVPCVFQIWRKRVVPRPVEVAVAPVGYTYVKAEKGMETRDWHLAIRRVGGLAGRAFARTGGLGTGAELSHQSHYFIKFVGSGSEQLVEKVAAIASVVSEHIFPSNTVGPRSLSQGEVNAVLVPILAQVEPSQPQSPS